ncbi:Jasmonic acid carboxyl methyltransferase [Hibiscus syriacus]|uniref:Jasmonic acid carboxyl methyltransferase n=1 Tax=Hibiscus syriacus TaxID=106335 RepID=A0A6A3CI88_HIBSY|nr:Jasmonic acid carboxyl methyltransferase [Hibiscus syriacus]
MFQLLVGVGPYCLCLYAVLGLGAMVFVIRQLQKMLQQLNWEYSRTHNIPPGSLGLPFIGETIQFMAAINSDKGFYDFVRERSLRYGNCFKTNIFGQTHVFVRSTGSAKTILSNELGRFTKRYIKSIAELVGNRSLLCASPHHHKLLRASLVTLFSSNSISLLVKQFDRLIVDALSGWKMVPLSLYLMKLSRFASQKSSSLNMIKHGYLIDWELNWMQITFKAMCKMLLSLESGAELELLQEDVGQAEQLQLAAKTWKKSFLSLDDLTEMPYASKVVKESLRMASVVPWFPRLVVEDCEIEGYKIKKGWNVNIDARAIHLDPTVYNEPLKFNPSRFDDENCCKPYSFLAFGMGARTCLGINMAKAMMLVFLHRLLTTYEWKVKDSDSSTEKWALFSRLRSGCPVQVTRISNIQ